jgi:hypothetical protein
MFFDICNAEMTPSLSSLQKSEFLKLIGYYGLVVSNGKQFVRSDFLTWSKAFTK